MPVSPSALMAVSTGTPDGTGVGRGGGARAGDGPVLPAEEPLDELPGLEGRVARLGHLAHGEGAHDLADLHRGEIGVAGHPAALGGVDREVEVPHQRLAVGGLGRGGLDEAEVLRGDEPLGTAGEQPLAVHGSGQGCSSCGASYAGRARGASGRGRRARRWRDLPVAGEMPSGEMVSPTPPGPVAAVSHGRARAVEARGGIGWRPEADRPGRFAEPVAGIADGPAHALRVAAAGGPLGGGGAGGDGGVDGGRGERVRRGGLAGREGEGEGEQEQSSRWGVDAASRSHGGAIGAVRLRPEHTAAWLPPPSPGQAVRSCSASGAPMGSNSCAGIEGDGA